MDLEIDTAGNLVYTQIGLFLATDPDTCVLQSLATRLRLLPEEYTMAPTEGVDWDFSDLQSLLTSHITKDPRVAYIDYQTAGRGSTAHINIGIKSRSLS